MAAQGGSRIAGCRGVQSQGDGNQSRTGIVPLVAGYIARPESRLTGIKHQAAPCT